MTSRGVALWAALRVADGERITSADVAKRCGSRATAKRALAWLRECGIELYPASRQEDFVLQYLRGVSDSQLQAMRYASAYESGGLSGLERFISRGAQLELPGFGGG